LFLALAKPYSYVENRQGLPYHPRKINMFMVNALPFKAMFTNVGLL